MSSTSKGYRLNASTGILPNLDPYVRWVGGPD